MSHEDTVEIRRGHMVYRFRRASSHLHVSGVDFLGMVGNYHKAPEGDLRKAEEEAKRRLGVSPKD